MNLRLLTVRLDYEFTRIVKDGEPPAQPAAEVRRDRLGALGFDVSKMDDEQICSYPILGMTDTQFVELTIAGEKNMSVLASVIIEASI